MLRALKKYGTFLLVILIIYSAFWFYRVYDVKKEVEKFVEQLEDKNILLSYNSLKVGGFPLTIHLTFNDMVLNYEGAFGATSTASEWVTMRSNLLGTQLTFLFSQNLEHIIENSWISKHYKYYADVPFVLDVTMNKLGLDLDLDQVEKVHFKGQGFMMTDVKQDYSIRASEANDWLFERFRKAGRIHYKFSGEGRALQWPDVGVASLEGLPSLGKVTLRINSHYSRSVEDDNRYDLDLKEFSLEAIDRGFKLGVSGNAMRKPPSEFPVGKGNIEIASFHKVVNFLFESRIIQKPQTLIRLLDLWGAKKEEDLLTLELQRDEERGLTIGTLPFDEVVSLYIESPEKASFEKVVPPVEEVESSGGA